MKTACLLVLSLLMAGCAAPNYTPNDRTRKVSRAEYGSAWPFAVDDGKLDCVTPGQVIFRSGGKVYALNGTAEATQKYLPLAAILRSGTGVSPSRLVDDGLRLCND